MKRRVVLLGDGRKAGVRQAVEQTAPFIQSRAELLAVDLGGTFDVRGIDADLLVIFGGDGSILAAARSMGEQGIPTIGVNFGKFGFLTDIRSKDVETELGRVLAGEYSIEERLMLRAELAGERFLALNEIFIGPGTVGRVVTIEVHLDGEYATTYRGDGVLVATPTGSTGHSLSAGGPIVDPELEAILLTPVSPHSLTNRPLVVPPSVRVELFPVPDHADGHATFSADGQVTRPLAAGERVVVTRAPHNFPLVRSGIRTRYDVLRSRLGWSGQPPFEVDPEEAS
jgi:NAD+ kinase